MKIPTDKGLNSFQKPRSNWGAKKHGQPEAQYCLAWLCSHELVFSHLENHVPDIPSECNQIAAED
jgi:diketogulonate reductase-like aldo/keto reductase